MISRKKFNLIIATFVILFSVFAIIASNNTSKFSSPFKAVLPTDEPSQVWMEQVKGSSVSTVDESLNEDEIANENIEENTEAYRVIKVIDGDTVDVDVDGKTERLRLIGIDTPETVDPRKKVQCFGKEASNKAKELLSGQFVSLESDESQGERDKYKRLLRYVFLPDGTNFNLYMISEGYAHEYTYDEPYKYQAEFKQAEVDARNQEKGLWSPNTCSGNK